MSKIKYHVKITAVSEKQQNVEIEIYASSAQELFKNLIRVEGGGKWWNR